ncbi:MAG: ABC transporter substrate-binding protein, partial [Halanaerobiaceae bacterium]
MRKLFVGFITILLIFGLVSISHAEEDVLVTADLKDITTMDPAVWYDMIGSTFMRNVYEGLVRFEGESVDIEPCLAVSWEKSEDGREWIFNLRENVKFHDGTTFNAYAVKTNIERIQEIDRGPSFAVADIEEVIVEDEYKVKFVLSEPRGDFLMMLASLWGPRMVSPTAIEENE